MRGAGGSPQYRTGWDGAACRRSQAQPQATHRDHSSNLVVLAGGSRAGNQCLRAQRQLKQLDTKPRARRSGCGKLLPLAALLITRIAELRPLPPPHSESTWLQAGPIGRDAAPPQPCDTSSAETHISSCTWGKKVQCSLLDSLLSPDRYSQSDPLNCTLCVPNSLQLCSKQKTLHAKNGKIPFFHHHRSRWGGSILVPGCCWRRHSTVLQVRDHGGSS